MTIEEPKTYYDICFNPHERECLVETMEMLITLMNSFPENVRGISSVDTGEYVGLDELPRTIGILSSLRTNYKWCVNEEEVVKEDSVAKAIYRKR